MNAYKYQPSSPFMPRLWRIVISVAILLMGWLGSGAVHAYSGGSGTSGDPYLISSVTDLQALQTASQSATLSGIYFKQTADIDLAGLANWPGIGDYSTGMAFSGVYDGNGHAIQNLTINDNTRSSAGLFNYLGGTVKSLAVTSASVSVNNAGGVNVGILAGYAGGATITNIYVTGSVTGSGGWGGPYTGGLIGWDAASTVSFVYSLASVTSDFVTGGLIGTGTSNITNSFMAGTVSMLAGGWGAGSICGDGMNQVIISNAYSTASNPIVYGNPGTHVSSSTTSVSVSALVFQDPANFLTGAGYFSQDWDFTTIWQIDPAQNGSFPILMVPNAAPVASAVLIGGTPPLVGQPLTGSYIYSDAESDTEDVTGTAFRWVRSDSSAGIGIGAETLDAITKNYTPVGADQSNYLYFCVTPAALSGTTPGVEACSSATAAVGAPPTPTLSTPLATGYANQANFSFQANYDSTVFFTVIAGAGTCPADTVIEAHSGSPLYWGSTTISANTPKLYALRNLTQSTSYKLCAVSKDNSGTNYSSVQALAFSTVAGANVNNGVWTKVGAGTGTSGMVSPSRPVNLNQQLSMTIGSDGNPFMFYADASFGHVRKFDGSAWNDVGNSIYGVMFPAIALAQDDTPYIIYLDKNYSLPFGYYKASVKKFDGTNWVNVGAGSASVAAASNPAIAVAPDGTPYIAYADGSSNLVVEKFDGTNWVSVGAPGVSANAPPLVFGPDGLPYVAIPDSVNGYKASVIKFDGTNWNYVGARGFSADQALKLALAVDPAGQLLLAYGDLSVGQRLTVMKYNGTNWVAQGSAGMSPSTVGDRNVAFGPSGGLYVGYAESTTGGASAQTFNGSAWSYLGSQNFTGGSANGFFSMAFDRDGWLYAGVDDTTWTYPGMMKLAAPPAAAPTASSVTITGTAQVGVQLTGSYTYGDANGDLENTSGSGSSYRFIRSTDNSVATAGDNVNAATGTTSGVNQTYTLTSNDVGKYLFYCVTPKTTTGTLLTGTEVCSSATAAVAALPNHTVTFNANGGTGSMTAQVANVATNLTTNTFTKAGSTFAGWSTTSGGSVAYADGASYAFAADITLYAQWTALPSHTVTFNANGGTGSMTAQVANVATNLTANTFTKAGSTFAGWSTSSGGSVAYADGASYAFAADVTLYAQWTALPNHTVTFNANGGTGSMTAQVANVATNLTTNTFTRTGYTFSGWSTTSGGSVAYADGASYVFAADVTLYAQWTAVVVNGACAISGVPVTVAPTGVSACTAGSVTNTVSSASQFTWGCTGSGGGTSTTAAACSVPRGYNVTPSAAANGAITPNTVQVIGYNTTTSFTVTPNAGYTSNVAGSCGGNLSGTTYTTNAITTACTVDATFTPTGTQTNIPTRQSGVTASLDVIGCTAVGSAVFVDAPAAGKPANKAFPYGLLDFTLTGCVGSADVTVTYSQPIPAGAAYYKEASGTYSSMVATIGSSTVRFTLTDNGAGDADNTVGTIRDPSGLAFDLATVVSSIPTLSEWGMLFLVSLMAMFGIRNTRRRAAWR